MHGIYFGRPLCCNKSFVASCNAVVALFLMLSREILSSVTIELKYIELMAAASSNGVYL